MATQTYYNYWSDKIDFKEKIKGELYPLLQPYIGEPLTNEVLSDIKSDISDWMKDLDEVVFDCEIKIDVERKDDNGQVTDVIKFITVSPIDV